MNPFDRIDGPSRSDFCARCRMEPADCSCPEVDE
jgi:hypothetical protein